MKKDAVKGRAVYDLVFIVLLNMLYLITDGNNAASQVTAQPIHFPALSFRVARGATRNLSQSCARFLLARARRNDRLSSYHPRSSIFFVPIYGILETAVPGSCLDNTTRDPVSWQQFVYYSLILLSAAGYGGRMWARTLAGIGVTIGVLYVAILVARLVSLYDVQRKQGRLWHRRSAAQTFQ